MTAVVFGGLRMRKLRAAMTAIAIVLGVAMISGTYVLMDTTLHAFEQLFATAYSKATWSWWARARSRVRVWARRRCPRRC